MLADGDGARRAVRHAAVARLALRVVGDGALVEVVHAPAALLRAAPALVALVVVDDDVELGLDDGLRHLDHLQ